MNINGVENYLLGLVSNFLESKEPTLIHSVMQNSSTLIYGCYNVEMRLIIQYTHLSTEELSIREA